MSDTNMSSPQAYLEVGQIIPAFELPGADGMPHSPWTYKQRENLLLIFLQQPTAEAARELLSAFAREYRSFREENCSILAITATNVFTNLLLLETISNGRNELRPYILFPLLADPSGEVIARYTRWDSARKALAPSIVLADRYNALYQQWIAEREEDLPSINEILEDLRYMNRLCTP